MSAVWYICRCMSLKWLVSACKGYARMACSYMLHDATAILSHLTRAGLLVYRTASLWTPHNHMTLRMLRMRQTQKRKFLGDHGQMGHPRPEGGGRPALRTEVARGETRGSRLRGLVLDPPDGYHALPCMHMQSVTARRTAPVSLSALFTLARILLGPRQESDPEPNDSRLTCYLCESGSAQALAVSRTFVPCLQRRGMVSAKRRAEALMIDPLVTAKLCRVAENHVQHAALQQK